MQPHLFDAAYPVGRAGVGGVDRTHTDQPVRLDLLGKFVYALRLPRAGGDVLDHPRVHVAAV